MTVVNKIDRFHLVIDVINRVELHSEEALALKRLMETKLSEHNIYINEYGVDMPEIVDWKW